MGGLRRFVWWLNLNPFFGVEMNANDKLIESLREAADYFESHPDIPKMDFAFIHHYLFDKEALRLAAKAMGSFDKIATDSTFSLVHQIGLIKIEIAISRETVCKKIVTWDCPEDLESILRDPVETL